MTDNLAPLRLIDTSPGKFSLLLTDDRMAEVGDLFEAAGHEGGGYDWDTIARTVLRTEAPRLAGRFGFDPEAGMFCAYGTDEEALRELGVILAAVFHDRDRLAGLIAAADPDDWD